MSIDLDVLIEMVAGSDWKQVRARHWEEAREAAATLIDHSFESRYDLVALAGPFFNASERVHLLNCLSFPRNAFFVMLRASLEETLRRTRLQPDRGLTSDADFVTGIYEAIDWETVPPNDLEIDTDGRTIEEVVAAISEWLADRR